MPASRPFRFRLLTVLSLLACIALIAAWLQSRSGRHTRSHRVDAAFLSAAEEPLQGTPHLVFDPAAGVRPRRSHARDRETFESTTDDHGLFGVGERPLDIPGPRILLVGDDLLAWSVAEGDRLGTLVQQQLRTDEQFDAATVLDASCEGYGPVEIVQRAAHLVPRYRPHLTVVVLNLGDDIAALTDPRRAAFETGPVLIPPDAGGEVPEPLRPQWLRDRAPDLRLDLAARNLSQRGLLELGRLGGPMLEDRLAATMERLVGVATGPAGVLVVLAPAAVDLDASPFETALAERRGKLLDAERAAIPGQLVQAAIDEVGIASFDARSVLEQLGSDAHQTDGRLSAAAQRALAAPLAARIADRVRAF